MMQRCSERAFAMCPYRKECGTRLEATFNENSDCAEFNRKVDSMPMTNADRIRAMTDEELMKFIEDTGIAGCPYPAMSCRASCQVCISDWLKQPAEVSHD